MLVAHAGKPGDPQVRFRIDEAGPGSGATQRSALASANTPKASCRSGVLTVRVQPEPRIKMKINRRAMPLVVRTQERHSERLGRRPAEPPEIRVKRQRIDRIHPKPPIQGTGDHRLEMPHSAKYAKSLPLDRRWRLAGNVIHHPVDAAHFIDDAVGNLAEQAVR